MTLASVTHNLLAFARAARLPSRRGLAALAKLNGHRLERRWPFFPRDAGALGLLEYADLLELQYARSAGRMSVLVVGAFDGMANDPIASFVQRHDCDVVFVEPQAGAFEKLCANMAALRGARFVNAAIDAVSGSRELFYVSAGIETLPAWTAQLASFDREHIVKHETNAAGVSAHIRSRPVRTFSFDDLMAQCAVTKVDVLQIDAEGFDAALLAVFPFERLRPGVVHYEVAHMPPDEHAAVRARLASVGYTFVAADLDEIAVQA